jgi:hypothetical protein
MTKGLRVAIDELARQGLRVIRVSQGGRHLHLHLADGRRVILHYGSRVGADFEKIQRQQARRLARQQPPQPPPRTNDHATLATSA